MRPVANDMFEIIFKANTIPIEGRCRDAWVHTSWWCSTKPGSMPDKAGFSIKK